MFSTTQFEAPPLLHTMALLAALVGMSHLLEERLPPDERPAQQDLSTASYLQIAAKLPADRIIVLNLQEFSTLVSANVTDLYPAFARYVPPRVISVDTLLKLSHLIVRDPSGVLRREPSSIPQQTPSAISDPALFPPPAEMLEMLEMLQLLATRIAEASSAPASQHPAPPSTTPQNPTLVPSAGPVAPEARAPPPSTPAASDTRALPPSVSTT